MRYWLQRLGAAIVLLLAVSALTFGAMNLLGDPLFNILGPTAASTLPEDLEIIEAAKAEYNLDDPLPVRYVKWASAFVTGDFGVQFTADGQPPVSNLIKERLPRTLMLLIIAQSMAVMLDIPWPLLAASRADNADDAAARSSALKAASSTWYNVAIAFTQTKGRNTDYTITATAQSNQSADSDSGTSCATLQVTALGNQTPADCWN